MDKFCSMNEICWSDWNRNHSSVKLMILNDRTNMNLCLLWFTFIQYLGILFKALDYCLNLFSLNNVQFHFHCTKIWIFFHFVFTQVINFIHRQVLFNEWNLLIYCMKNTYCLFQVKFITEYTNVQHIIITQI